MSKTPGESREDELLERLAALDEALAIGENPTSESGNKREKDEELRQAEDCVRLLNQLWPRSPSSLEGDATCSTIGLGARRPTPSVEAPIPQKLGRFQIVREIGRGGCGVVFLALDPSLNREVALKTLHLQSFLRSELQTRFLQEAQIAARLDHPNIVPVHESGIDEGVFYIVYAFRPGIDLGKWIRQQSEPIPAQQSAQIIADIAEAVHHAHQQGVLHRDLKPGNVILQVEDSEEGKRPQTVPRITDFGLAKLLDEDGSQFQQTQSGAVMGTPAYMAPEQAEGRTEDIDRPADTYGVGAILYEMLTGRPPFQGTSPLDILSRVSNEDPVPPRRLRSDIPRDLETICLKCLRKRPTDRYASARELALDLRRFLNGEPIEARSIHWTEKAGRWCKRHPTTVVSLIATCLFLFVFLPGWWWYSDQLQASQEREHLKDAAAKSAHRAETEANKAKEAVEELAKTQKHFLILSKVQARRAFPTLGWTQTSLKDIRAAVDLGIQNPDLVALRSEAATCLGSVDLLQPRVVYSTITAGALAYSHDGRYLAVAAARPNLTEAVTTMKVIVLEGRTGKLLRELELPFRLLKKDPFLPDGARSMAFGPDHQTLYVGTRSGWVHRWDLTKPDAPRTEWRASEEAIEILLLTPDGKFVLTGKPHEQVLRCWATKDTSKPVCEYVHKPGAIMGATVNARGQLVVSGAGLHFFRIPELMPLRQVRKHTGKFCQSSNQNLFAVLDDGPRISLYDEAHLQKVATWPNNQESAHGESIDWLQFSPDGSVLGTLCYSEKDRTLKIWEVASSRLLATLPLEGRGRARASFHPTLPVLAVAVNSQVCLYPISGVPIQQRIAQHAFPIQDFCFLPNADSLVTLNRSWDHIQQEQTPVHAHEMNVWDFAGTLKRKHLQHIDSRFPAHLAGHPPTGRLAWVVQDRWVDWISSPFADTRAKFPCVQARDPGLSPDGKRLWSICRDSLHVQAWDWHTKEVCLDWESVVPRLPRLYCLDVGNNWVVVGGRDGNGRLLRTGNAKLEKILPGSPEATVFSIALRGDEQLAAMGCNDGQLRLYQIPTGKKLLPPAVSHSAVVTSVTFSPEGQWLVSGSADRHVHLYRRLENRYHLYLRIPMPDRIRHVRFHPHGNQLGIVVENESAVRVWHLDRLDAELAKLNLNEKWTPYEVEGWTVQRVAERGKWLRENGEEKLGLLWLAKALRLAEEKQPELSKAIREEIIKRGPRPKLLWGHRAYRDRRFGRAMFSPDGKLMLTRGSHELHAKPTAHLWETSTGKRLDNSITPEKFFTSAIFSPKGKMILTTTHGKVARLWEVPTCKPLSEPIPLPFAPLTSCFRPDGKEIAIGGEGGKVFFWDVNNHKQIHRPLETPKGESIHSLSYSPDGRHLLCGSIEGSCIWDLIDLKRLPPRFPHEGKTCNVTYSVDGKLIGYAGVPARLWDATTMKLVRTLAHPGRVWRVDFSRDGQLASTAGEDRTARVFQLATGKQIFLLNHPKAVFSAAFHPGNQSLLATSCYDGILRLWQLPPTLWGKTAQQLSAQLELFYGSRLTETGKLQALTPTEVAQRQRLIQSLKSSRLTSPASASKK